MNPAAGINIPSRSLRSLQVMAPLRQEFIFKHWNRSTTAVDGSPSLEAACGAAARLKAAEIERKPSKDSR